MFTTNRYIIVYELKDCPNIPMYLFIWYGITVTKWFYINIKHLIKHMKFGNVFSSIGKMFNNIFSVHKTVTVHYKVYYRDKYDAYYQHITDSNQES